MQACIMFKLVLVQSYVSILCTVIVYGTVHLEVKYLGLVAVCQVQHYL